MRNIIGVETPVVGTAGAVAQDATEYSTSMQFAFATGEVCMFLTTTAGTITVTQQCSLDNENWYDPINSAAGALGGVRAGLGVTTGVYISFAPVLAPYIRFKVVEANVAATTVTMKLLFQEVV